MTRELEPPCRQHKDCTSRAERKLEPGRCFFHRLRQLNAARLEGGLPVKNPVEIEESSFDDVRKSKRDRGKPARFLSKRDGKVIVVGPTVRQVPIIRQRSVPLSIDAAAPSPPPAKTSAGLLAWLGSRAHPRRHLHCHATQSLHLVIDTTIPRRQTHGTSDSSSYRPALLEAPRSSRAQITRRPSWHRQDKY